MLGDAEVHVARAGEMVRRGRRAEAKHYLRHMAISSIHYARWMAKQRTFADSVEVKQRHAAALALGLTCARESRSIRAGGVKPARASLPYWKKRANPHWPNSVGCGVFVVIHDSYRYKVQMNRPRRIIVEVQVHPPDEQGSSCCSSRLFHSDEDRAVEYARKWVTVGEAVVEAAVSLNAKGGLRGKREEGHQREARGA